MFDFSDQIDRVLTYRLGAAYDCWGFRRTLRRGSHNGLWLVDVARLDAPAADDGDDDADVGRARVLAAFERSGRFTSIELATLRALVVDRLTFDEIAERDRCSRQAVVARLVGNSRGQGGILKKAQALLNRGDGSNDNTTQASAHRRERPRAPAGDIQPTCSSRSS